MRCRRPILARGAIGALVVVIAASCSSAPPVESIDREEAIAVAAATVDDRPAVLDRLGVPDSFQLTLDEVEGSTVQFESWAYHDLGTRIDFVDGVVAWTVDIEDLPDGSLLPVWYAPGDFNLLMPLSEAATAATEGSPVAQQPTSIDLADGGEEYANALFLTGDQVLLGFVEDTLVYAETFALVPDAAGSDA